MAAVDKIEEKRKPEDFIGHRNRTVIQQSIVLPLMTCRGQIQRPERVAAVDKIEEMRKPEDFIGYRNRSP